MMSCRILSIAFLAVSVSALPAPAPAAVAESPAKTQVARQATTSRYEAPRPSGAPGIFLGEDRGDGIAGGHISATGGDAAGEAAGTLLYGSVHQGAGHVSGGLGPLQGELVGTINDAGFAKGCAGGAVDGVGYTQCLQFPPRAPAPTGVFYSEVHSNGALGGVVGADYGQAGGEAAGTVLYGDQQGAAGHLAGNLGPAEGELGGSDNLNGNAQGYAGGAIAGIGYTQTVHFPPRAPEPTGIYYSETHENGVLGGVAGADYGQVGGEAAGTLLYGDEKGAAGSLSGHLGPAEGVLGGSVNDGVAQGYGGGAIAGVGYTQAVQFPPRAQPTGIYYSEVHEGGELGGVAGAEYGQAGGEASGTLLYGDEKSAAGQLKGHLGPADGVIGGSANADGSAQGYAGGAIAGAGYTQALQYPPRAAATP